MAMKQQLLNNHIEATYWRVVGYSVSVTGKMCQIFLVGYKNEEERQENKYLISKNYMISQDKFDEYLKVEDGVFVADLYKYLKTEEEDFEGAEDILE